MQPQIQVGAHEGAGLTKEVTMALENDEEHIIAKRVDEEILLRPRAKFTLSFRGTPGGKVTVRVGSKKGPGLGDTEEPVDDGSGPVIIVDDLLTHIEVGKMKRQARRRAGTTKKLRRVPQEVREEVLFDTIVRHSLPSEEDGGEAVALKRPESAGIHRPTLGLDTADDLVVTVPERPDHSPQPRPRPAVGVSIEVREGVRLAQNNLLGTADGPSMEFLRAGPFPGHDIVDVTYTNLEEFPILVYTFVHVQNEFTPSTTELSSTLLQRVFGGTLLWLAPVISVRDGLFRFAFQDEVMHTLGLNPVTTNIGVSADVGLRIEPISFELLNHEEIVQQLVTDFVGRLSTALPTGSHFAQGLDADLVDAYFREADSIQRILEEFPDLVPWKKFLNEFPILKSGHFYGLNRDDVGLRFHLRLTEVSAGLSVLKLNVDTVTATLDVVLYSGSRPEPHSSHLLRDDFVSAGFVVPRFHLQVDIGDIDVDIDLPGGSVVKPFEFVAEAGLEGLAEWLKDSASKRLVDEGMGFLEKTRVALGEYATTMVHQISNRGHVLRRLAATPRGWKVVTRDPAELAVPYVEPDTADRRFDGIAERVPPVSPMDGPIPEGAHQRLQRVDHLVFLMMENRSFDHMLGYLSHPNHAGRGDVDGLDGGSVALGGAFTGTSATPQSEVRDVFRPDPGHGVETVALQINGGRMDGFVSEFFHRLESGADVRIQGNLRDPERVLRFHTADQLPVYDRLTRTDMALDRWFSSVPGATYPNRFCYYTGVTPHLANAQIFADAGYQPQLTFLDVLDHEGVDWICYESDFSFVRVFENFRLDTQRIRPIEELFTRGSSLPPVTLIDPNFTGAPSSGAANDDHPPTSIAAGQAFVSSVIGALQDLPSWPRTMLVITYDEHGGFADHVPPPGTPLSDFPLRSEGSEGVIPAHPDLVSLGVRVPAMVVSPVITAGSIGHGVFEHASVFRTVLERFAPDLVNSPIIAERVRAARHLGELVEPDPTSSADISRVPTPFTFSSRVASGVVHRYSDDFRPHLAPPPTLEDLDLFIARFGNPIIPSM